MLGAQQSYGKASQLSHDCICSQDCSKRAMYLPLQLYIDMERHAQLIALASRILFMDLAKKRNSRFARRLTASHTYLR